MLPDLMAAMAAAADEIKNWLEKKVLLLHHNDADGLAAGAILTRAFERAGFAVDRYCLEKPYPAILEKVFRPAERLIVFADFAGRIAPLISDLNEGRNLVLILDHHKTTPVADDQLHHLNPELYGLAGDRDMSAAATAYYFARTLDADNMDLAPIAVIGAVGDGFFVDGRLAGPNREVAKEAVQQGGLEIRTEEAGENYIYRSGPKSISCRDLSAYLDTLGAAGYFQNGPEVGIQVCFNGITPASDRIYANLKALQAGAFGSEFRRISQGGLRETEHIQWFHAEDRFAPMGVKAIGAFCEHYKERAPFKSGKFTAGFQIIPNEVPGFGPLALNQVKISMRVSGYLQREIRAGRVPGLDAFLPAATSRLGGFADACHSLAAATTIALGKETALIQAMETMLTKHFTSTGGKAPR